MEVDADSINYLTIEDYIKCTGLTREQFCLGCITNDYPTPMADSIAKQMWDKLRRGEAEKGRIYEST
jgi:glutamine phosphoribosylpyrophosphate amidotransferase